MRVSEEYLKNYPRETSKLFIAGYILRIIPVANIIGAVLTAIGYYKLWNKWIKYTLIALGVLGSILFIVAASINVYYGFLSSVISQPEVSGTTSVDVFIKTIDSMIDQLSKWYTIIPPLLVGLGLILEALALHGIRLHIGSSMPRYIVIIMFIYGLLEILQPAAIFATIPRLRSLREELAHTTYIQPSTIAFKLLAALIPMLIIVAIIFIMTLLAYILLAYRFHVLSKLSREAALLESTGEEAGEEIVI
jgi:hypothetical protein